MMMPHTHIGDSDDKGEMAEAGILLALSREEGRKVLHALFSAVRTSSSTDEMLMFTSVMIRLRRAVKDADKESMQPVPVLNEYGQTDPTRL